MGRKGTGGHNAGAASCCQTRKPARIDLAGGDPHAPGPRAVVEDRDVCSTRQRCHSAIGDLAPLADEHALQAQGIFCPEKC
jgi:hypothetical protein